MKVVYYSNIVIRILEKNLKVYKKLYNLTESEVNENFLLLPESEFNPFITESAIYNASKECVACAAPAMDDTTDVIKFHPATSKRMARAFKALWKKYKRTNP